MLLLRCRSPLPPPPPAASVHYGLFGDLHLVRPAAAADGAVLFFSDAAGWTVREEAYAGGAGRPRPARGRHRHRPTDDPWRPQGRLRLPGRPRRGGGALDRAPRAVRRPPRAAGAGPGSGAGFAYALVAQAPRDVCRPGHARLARVPAFAKSRCAAAMPAPPPRGWRAESAWCQWRVSRARLPLPFAATDAYDGFAALRPSALGALPALWRAATAAPTAPSPPAVAARVALAGARRRA